MIEWFVYEKDYTIEELAMIDDVAEEMVEELFEMVEEGAEE